jgi:hypothetical protein
MDGGARELTTWNRSAETPFILFEMRAAQPAGALLMLELDVALQRGLRSPQIIIRKETQP